MHPACLPVIVMVDALEREPLEELERAMASLRTKPAPRPRERHQQSLLHLGRMVAATPRLGPGSVPRIPRREYDAERPADAPSSRVLVDRFGSWLKACRAAQAANATDASARTEAVGAASTETVDWRSGARPWGTPSLGGRRNANYTKDEVLTAVLEVARRLEISATHLTSTAYYTYVAEMRRRARESSASPPRLPTQRSVERYFTSWKSVRRALARLDPAEDRQRAPFGGFTR